MNIAAQHSSHYDERWPRTYKNRSFEVQACQEDHFTNTTSLWPFWQHACSSTVFNHLIGAHFILEPRALLFCAWLTERRDLGNPGTKGPRSFVICCWLRQRKRFCLINLWRGNIWTCVAKVVPASWEFCLFSMEITERLRSRKMCSFRRFLSLQTASKVQDIIS